MPREAEQDGSHSAWDGMFPMRNQMGPIREFPKQSDLGSHAGEGKTSSRIAYPAVAPTIPSQLPLAASFQSRSQNRKRVSGFELSSLATIAEVRVIPIDLGLSFRPTLFAP